MKNLVDFALKEKYEKVKFTQKDLFKKLSEYKEMAKVESNVFENVSIEYAKKSCRALKKSALIISLILLFISILILFMPTII